MIIRAMPEQKVFRRGLAIRRLRNCMTLMAFAAKVRRDPTNVVCSSVGRYR